MINFALEHEIPHKISFAEYRKRFREYELLLQREYRRRRELAEDSRNM